MAKRQFDGEDPQRMAEAQRECHAIWTTVERLAGIGGWSRDIANDKLFWSNEVYRIFGRDPQDYPATLDNFLSIIHPDDLGRIQEARAATRAHNAPYDVEFRIIRPDNTVRFIHTVAESTLDETGKVVRLTGTLHDITERKAAERAARDELRRIQAQRDIIGEIGQSDALMSGDVEAIARQVTELAAGATGCERVNVWLFDGTETELRCIDLFEATPARHSAGMILSDKNFGDEIAVLKTSRFVAADDPLTDPRTRGYVGPYLKPLGITSMLDVVIEASGRYFGLLCFEHVGKSHHWTHDEISFACQLADKIGLAIVSRRRRQAESELRQRDALLHALAVCAAEFVNSSSLDTAMPTALELVSRTMRVDRMTVLEGPETTAEVPKLRYIWHVPGIETVVDDQFFDDPNIRTPEFEAWRAPLFDGRIVISNQRDASSEIKGMLDNIGTKSLLLVPIMIDGNYWGQLGFESFTVERQWADFEIEILQTLGTLIGNTIRRQRYVQEIAAANRIIENTPTVLYRLRLTPERPMTYVSQNVRLFGYEASDLLASPRLYQSFPHPDDVEAVRHLVAKALDEGAERGQCEFRLLAGDGEYRWVEDHFTPIRDAAGQAIELEGLVIDITERKAAETKMLHLAHTDQLTGLANRATFMEQLRQAFASSRRGTPTFALLTLDIDRFKEVNDSLGHPLGDELLTTVGERLRASVRESDVVARLGGDEFAVLQLGLGATSDAGALASKIRSALAAPVSLSGNQLRITASIGIATYAPEIASPEVLLAQADVALYRAKEEGRDQYRFHTQELDVEVREQVALAAELAGAIDREEFVLHFQPQVEMATGRNIGMQALMRWRHPTRGLLMPSAFLSAAERSGAITGLGRWAINGALQQMRLWREAGTACPTMAIAVTYAQIRKSGEFVELVSEALDRWGVAPGELELYVTESMLAQAVLAQNDVFKRLRTLGVGIAIDDVGSRCSTFDYLRTDGINRLKISQSLIDAASHEADSAAVIQAIAAMAQVLGVEVIAEMDPSGAHHRAVPLATAC